MAKKIKQFFVDGQPAKAAKSSLDDDVTSLLLPVAEATDEGKVIVVGASGDYELSEVGQGALVVNCIEASKGYKLDKTYDEIVAAEQAGQLVKLHKQASNGSSLVGYLIDYHAPSDSNCTVHFVTFNAGTGGVSNLSYQSDSTSGELNGPD
jgi:hypothetical protein